MDITEGLNPEQLRAVTHVGGPMLVVAGAGTGKTQVITRRIAHLIARKEARPQEILALTFTEKAAREMADRLYGLIGWDSFSVPVITFNAFGAELLSRYASHIGRGISGGLINDTQKSLLLKQHFSEITFKYYRNQFDWYEFAVQMTSYIGRLQNAGIDAEAYSKFVEGLKAGDMSTDDILEQQDLVAVYHLYEHLKEQTATYDYYDQLALPVRILRERPNLASRLGALYKFVLVDEYQDTSPVQDALLRLIVPPSGNIFAVGDDDQAIYGFRGADITGIMNFADHYGVTAPVTLIQNYRSGQPVLDASYRLIKNNDPERLESRLGLDKRLRAQHDDARADFIGYDSPALEQTAVTDAIAGRITNGESAGSIAVLARSNAILQSYAKTLRARGIPFAISTEVNVFEQREMINLWNVLGWIGGRANDQDIAHIVLGPFFGWTSGEWQEVALSAKDNLEGYEAALRRIASEDGSHPAAQVIGRLDAWRGWAAEETVVTLIARVISEAVGSETPLIVRLQANAQSDGREQRVIRVFDDLQRYMSEVESYVEVQALAGGDTGLAEYLRQYPRPPKLQVAETVGDDGGVQLLTVHASKGLEFDTVYLVNTTARAWSEQPDSGLLIPSALVAPSDLPAAHEARRLMYVAITRARKHIIVSAPLATAGGQRQAVSPLVAEALGLLPESGRAVESKASGLDNSLRKVQRHFPLEDQMPSRLPFEREDGWIELGVNDLKAYDDAPHDFYLEKVLGVSRPFGPQLAFGSAVHAAIERFYKTRLEGLPDPPVDELLVCLDESWKDRGYETRYEASLAHEVARDTVVRFYNREQGAGRIVVASEQAIRFEVPEVKLRLRGRIDATFATDGGLEVRDFKTGQLRDPEKLAAKAKASFQLRTYALAIQEASGSAPACVTLDYVVTGAEGTTELSPKILANHRDKLVKLAERLRARDFHPGAPNQLRPTAAFTYYGEDDEPEPIA